MMEKNRVNAENNGYGNPVSKWVMNAVLWIYAALLLFTVCCVFFNRDIEGDNEFVITTSSLLIQIAVIVGMFLFVRIKCLTHQDEKKHHAAIIVCGCMLIFVFQRFIANSIIFGTGWDSECIVNFALRIASGKGEKAQVFENGYISKHTNNIVLVLIYSLILRLRMLVTPGLSYRDALLTLSCVNSLLSCLSAVFVYFCTKVFAKNRYTAVLAFIVYGLLVGVSPWFLIPYSDAFSLIFPLLIIFLYYTPLLKCSKWALMGIIIYIGFRIKAQVLIVCISIVINEVLSVMSINRKNGGQLFKRLVVLASSMFIVHMLFLRLPYDRVGWNIDENRAFGITHYFMLGQNRETTGRWSADDVKLSEGFVTKEERTAANIQLGMDRIREGTVGDYIHFLINKNTGNMSDGTFAWGKEGEFVKHRFYEEQTITGEFLSSLFYPDGENYAYLKAFFQPFWISVLLGCIFSLVGNMYKRKELFVLNLCVMGIILFNLIFEARARYVYIFVPIIIITGCIGYESVANWIEKKALRTEGK